MGLVVRSLRAQTPWDITENQRQNSEAPRKWRGCSLEATRAYYRPLSDVHRAWLWLAPIRSYCSWTRAASCPAFYVFLHSTLRRTRCWDLQTFDVGDVENAASANHSGKAGRIFLYLVNVAMGRSLSGLSCWVGKGCLILYQTGFSVTRPLGVCLLPPGCVLALVWVV